jgi:hypothetical protein
MRMRNVQCANAMKNRGLAVQALEASVSSLLQPLATGETCER